MQRLLLITLLSLTTAVQAKVSSAEANRLGKDLTPMGAETAANKDGSIPAWTGGHVMTKPAAGTERTLATYKEFSNDKPLYAITAANMAQYKDQLTTGHQTLMARFPDTYRMNVYPSRRSSSVPDFIATATRKNALNAELGNEGEALINAVTGTPFPIPQSGLEIMWNHKTRYRGLSLMRYNIQLAVQSNGDFLPYELREDVRFQYSYPDQTPEALNNVIIYFLQLTTNPPRQAGSVLLVHETMDQVKEARRAWLYNPGQRRIRRAPNVAYDNPGNGSDGLRTNDQLDVFNGATDRYTWKLLGKKEMIIPYNAAMLVQNSLKYTDIAKKGHLNADLARYEPHRVWVVEATLKPGTSHIYARRVFYVDEDTWTIVHADLYDRRNALWRVQESHTINLPWLQRTGSVCGTVYDLQSSRYLLMDLSNEEPLFQDKDFDLNHFTTGNVVKLATK